MLVFWKVGFWRLLPAVVQVDILWLAFCSTLRNLVFESHVFVGVESLPGGGGNRRPGLELLLFVKPPKLTHRHSLESQVLRRCRRPTGGTTSFLEHPLHHRYCEASGFSCFCFVGSSIAHILQARLELLSLHGFP